MRKYFIIFLCIFFSSCVKKNNGDIFSVYEKTTQDIDINYNVPGNSITKGKLRHDVLVGLASNEKLYKKLYEEKPIGGKGIPISKLNILNTTFKEWPEKKSAGWWKEIWTVERLGPNTDYQIGFMPDGKGNTFIFFEKPTEHVN